MIDTQFWSGKRVFLTGHTGFKGSWLSLWLGELGAQVHGFALEPPTNPSLYTLAKISNTIDETIADVRDSQAVFNALEQAAPDIVIHMAAQPLVRASYEQPVETYGINVMGTVHLLDAIRRLASPALRAVVNVTSDKCYDNQEWYWGYREHEPKGGHDPYSNSKGCAELVTDAFRSSYFSSGPTALASARAGNVIGGGDWAQDRLIPDLLDAIATGRSIEIRNPDAIRPWQHVLEPLSGYLQLAQKLYEQGQGYAGGWNFGPRDQDARPVLWIVEQLVQEWGGDAKWHLPASVQPHEAHYLKLDCSKALAALQWQPRWSLEQTLAKIVAWQQAHIAGQDMRAVSLNEIRAYESLSSK